MAPSRRLEDRIQELCCLAVAENDPEKQKLILSHLRSAISVLLDRIQAKMAVTAFAVENGVQLTGMPAWSSPHQETEVDSWLQPLTEDQKSQESRTSESAHYVGSQSCQKCHAQIYEHWRKTPMANVVRDPREHPDAIIPDLATNSIAKFRKGRCRAGLRQPLEATLLHEKRRRLFSGTRTVGRYTSRLASVFRR